MNVIIPLEELAPDVRDALRKRCIKENRPIASVAKEILSRAVSTKKPRK
jgi:hypothetical protein